MLRGLGVRRKTARMPGVSAAGMAILMPPTLSRAVRFDRGRRSKSRSLK